MSASEVLGIEKLGDRGLTIRTLVRTVAGSQWEARPAPNPLIGWAVPKH